MRLTFLHAFTSAVVIAAAALMTADAVAAQKNTKPLASGSDPRARVDRCAAKDAPADQLAVIEQMLNATGDKGGLVIVPVYWHVITNKGDGDVSALIPAQMQVLNDAFAGSNFAFENKGVEVIRNNAWFFSAAGSPEEIQMKDALKKGGPETLNIYTANGDVVLGWATLPFFYKFFPRYDGVVLWWAALPRHRPGGYGRRRGTGWRPDLRRRRYRHARDWPLARLALDPIRPTA